MTEQSAERRIVGIDLGTSHTVVAQAPHGDGEAAEILPLSQLVSMNAVEARPLLASTLYAPIAEETPPDPWGDAPFLIGEFARTRGLEVAGRSIASSKSWLCHAAVDRLQPILPWGNEVAGDVPRVSPVDAARRILQHVSACYAQRFPAERLGDQELVLTVPASFDQVARELTLRAAQEAGLSVRLLEEPQAAFYAALDAGLSLEALLERHGEGAPILVCDVGGGTTDLTLIELSRKNGSPEVTRVAVGRHLLLGGDNMDLALAHRCEGRLMSGDQRLDPARFAQLVLACRAAKERLLSDGAPNSLPIRLLGRGSSLVGSTLSTELSRDEVESLGLDGFFPMVARDARPQRARAGLLAFGLPYEADAAISRHIAAFFARHSERRAPAAVLLNGGVFRAAALQRRLLETLASWADQAPELLPFVEPDLAVARGAVVFGKALHGYGRRIAGGTARGYYVGLERNAEGRLPAVCVVPKGAVEGERHLARERALALRVGKPVRFELYASDDNRVHAPGEVVEVDDERFLRLPPATVNFAGDDAGHDEVGVALEGELSAVGTVELGCVELDGARRRFQLAFDLRAEAESAKASVAPKSSVKSLGQRMQEAREAIERVFGKGRGDVKAREVKDLWRELERILGARAAWDGELNRALFDCVGPKHAARRRSADHERVYWMLAGYCLRPGFGHPVDAQRMRTLMPRFDEGVGFGQEARNWQQFFIAWRRVAGGISGDAQERILTRIAPFLAPDELKLKKPKGFKPQALDELLELASRLERVPSDARAELGRWLLDRTWTDRDPRLWAAIGRIGARAPAYASAHHAVSPRTVERWLDHLLREKWEETSSAARAAFDMARVTGDRARDISDSLRKEVVNRLAQADAPREWQTAVSEFVPISHSQREEFFGEELPAGLRLVEQD